MDSFVARIIAPADADAPAPIAPVGLNGASYTVDMASSHQAISERNFVAVDRAGVFNLRYSMAYVLWFALGKPVAPVAVTAEAVTSCVSRWGELINVHVLLSLIAHTENAPAIIVRGTDVRSAGWFVPRAAIFEQLLLIVDRCYAVMDTDPVVGGRHKGTARFCMWLLVLNAWHRETNDGHNFYTDRVTAQRGEGSRFVAIAGASAGQFREWLTTIGASGHDMWHFLSTQSLTEIAKIIVGEREAVVTADGNQGRFGAAAGYVGRLAMPPLAAVPAQAAAGAPVEADDEDDGDDDDDDGDLVAAQAAAAGGDEGVYLYNGENVVGRTVNEVLAPGEACEDRYPPGTQGISVVFLGLEYLGIMLISMSAKVNVGNGAAFQAAAATLGEALRVRRLPRAEVIAVRDVMAPVIGISAGYLSKMPEYADSVAAAQSIRAFMEANKGLVARGVALHGVISQAQASAAAMNAAFTDSIDQMVTAINRTSAEVIAAGNNAGAAMPNAPAVVPRAAAVGVVVANPAANILD